MADITHPQFSSMPAKLDQLALVWWWISSFAKCLQFVQNDARCYRPDEGLWIAVVLLDVVEDGLLEFRY